MMLVKSDGKQIRTYHPIQNVTPNRFKKNIIIRPDTINLIEERGRNSLELISTVKYFLNRIQKAQALSTSINKWDIMKLNIFHMAQDTHSDEVAAYRI